MKFRWDERGGWLCLGQHHVEKLEHGELKVAIQEVLVAAENAHSKVRLPVGLRAAVRPEEQERDLQEVRRWVALALR
jgi:hypothetical protein